MRSITLWSELLNDKQEIGQCVFDVAFKPDGSQILAAVGNKVLVYNASDGKLIQALKGHKENVYCVSYSKDGKRFASGSSDKSVIVWTDKLKGILKFTHNDAIQCVQYNPVTPQLISCAMSDFGLWAPEQKSVNKHKVHNRITSCSWTNDGQYVALGLYSGLISIRSKLGEEKVRIERPGGSNAPPVWCLRWNSNRNDADDILTVGDWGQKLSFYHLNGKQIGKDVKLDFDPLTIRHFDNGKYLLIGGSNGKLSLYSREGIYLGNVSDGNKGWVWSCATRSDSNVVVVGHEEGLISTCALTFSTVHGLYQDCYAYRDKLTEVVVQRLNSHYNDSAEDVGSRIHIRCNDLVRKISVYKDKLAVQLSDRIVLYQFVSDESRTTYKQINRIVKQFDCNLLVVCSENLILCQENKLTCLSMEGVKQREWILDANIRYIKVIGGARGREGLLLGLKNGQVLQIFVDNPFPIELLKINNPVRCLDLSMSRTKLAIINDNSTCLVYDLTSKELLFEELNATSVAWNTQNEDMLCYSDKGYLNIKAGSFPSHQRRMNGFVVGYCGSRIFCLQVHSMKSIDVPQSAPMYQYLDHKQFIQAYKIACLGVTEGDWDQLAHSALEGLNFDVARKAFTRTRNLRYLELIQSIEDRQRRGEVDSDLFLADINAYKSEFNDAAKLYRKIGMSQKAVDMYTDLRMFELAKEYVESTNPNEHKQLIAKQASWAKNTNEPREAAKMYLAAGEDMKALEIIGQHGWTDMLMQVARKLDKADRDALTKCADYLKRLQQYAYCVEVYNKLGDKKAIVMLHVETGNWEEAFALVEKNGEFKNDVYVPYAQWLAENDRFEEAQKAFHMAGRITDALRVLEQLTENAVNESRFNDAGYYYWMLSMQCLDIARAEDQEEVTAEMLEKFKKYQRLGEIYYVYHSIQRYADEPFTSHLPEALFNLSRFLMHAIMTGPVPKGISKVATLWALAKQSRQLGAYKVARFAYEKLHALKLPLRFQDLIDLGAVSIRSKPFHDGEDLLPLCYRCSTTNPCINQQGSRCINCKQPYVYSFSSFEVLPLVEFTLAEGISDEEACRLIDASPTISTANNHMETREFRDDNTQSLQFGDKHQSGDGKLINGNDPFDSGLLTFDPNGQFQPVVVDRKVLRELSRNEIVIRRWPSPLRYQYFRNLVTEVMIAMCDSCYQMFHADDYELVVLQNQCCPFCRKKTEIMEEEDEQFADRLIY